MALFMPTPECRPMRLATLLVATLSAGCSLTPPTMSESPPSSLKIEQKYDEFVRFHPDGEIELKSLGTARLAGVRIRDVNETSQPESWDAVAKLVTSVSRSVFVERDPASGKIVVFYRQPIRLPDHYFPWYLNARKRRGSA